MLRVLLEVACCNLDAGKETAEEVRKRESIQRAEREGRTHFVGRDGLHEKTIGRYVDFVSPEQPTA
jgi:hypothetical protein